MSKVRIAFDADNHLGETPAWSASEQALYWVNCEHPPELHRWHPGSGEHRVWPMPKRIGGFVFKAAGGMLVALNDGIYDFDLESAALDLRAPSPFPDYVNLHECCTDRQGRFWIGGYDTRYPADRSAMDAGWCRLEGDKLIKEAGEVHVSNGLAFSPDGRTMYGTGNPTRRIDAWDVDPATGRLSNRREFLTLPEGEGFADGATVDAEGGYWLAAVGAGALRRYLPDGTLDRIVPLTFSFPTKPAFGGSGMKTLFVTSGKNAAPGGIPDAVPDGPVFALEPGECGLADTRFAG